MTGSIPSSISDPEVPPFANPNAVSHMSQTAIDVLDELPEPEHIVPEKITHFMSHDLYSKYKKLKDSGEDRYYKLIIFLERDPSSSELNDAKKNKDELEVVLKTKFQAKNIYKAKILSFISAEIPINKISELADYDSILVIGDREIETVLLGSTMTSIRADVRADSTGYSGNNVKVAIIDTGVNQAHPDLPIGSKIIYQADCTSSTCIEYTSANSAMADTINHGSHVAGIVAGGTFSNANRGVAYNADLIIAKSDANDIGSALDWVMTKGAQVANISIGSSGCSNSGYDSLAKLADEAVEKGLIVVAPVGSSAGTSPGCAFNVITVGGVDDQGNSNRTDDVLFTNFLGTTGDGRIKPDVVAPAVDISSVANTGSGYTEVFGESHASAIVTGAVAQLLEKNPSWTPAQVKAAIKQTAYLNSNLSPLSESQRGKGIVDVTNALSLATSSIDYSLAYGFDLNTYTVNNSAGSNVQYKIAKETSGSNIGSITLMDGKLKDINTFKKLSFSGIKVNGASQVLSDDKLFVAPWIDFLGQDTANTFVKYKLPFGDTVKLSWIIDAGDINLGQGLIQQSGQFNSPVSQTFEITHYLDYDIGLNNSDDKTTNTSSPATVFNTEQKITGLTTFQMREKLDFTPWFTFTSSGEPVKTQWILKQKTSESPTNNPDNYFSSTESINADGSGENFIIYYQGSRTSTSVFSGPTAIVNWVNLPEIACLPPTSDWIIFKDCVLASSSTAPSNITVDFDSTLTIPSGMTLDMDFANKHLLIKDGSKVIVKSGGKIS